MSKDADKTQPGLDMEQLRTMISAAVSQAVAPIEAKIDSVKQTQQPAGLTKEQIDDHLKTIAADAAQQAGQAARNMAAAAGEAIKTEAKVIAEATAKATAEEMMARKQKETTWKEYGKTAGVSAFVFTLGTAAMAGYNHFFRRDTDNGDRGTQ